MKYNIVHIILSVVLSLVCATACTSGQNPEVPNPGSSAVLRFGLQDVSRAKVTNDAVLRRDGFNVFGEMRFIHATSAPFYTELFNRTPVSYSSETNGWTYPASDTLRYWLPKHEYSFVALYPYDKVAGLDYDFRIPNSLSHIQSRHPSGTGQTIRIPPISWQLPIAVCTKNRLLLPTLSGSGSLTSCRG